KISSALAAPAFAPNSAPEVLDSAFLEQLSEQLSFLPPEVTELSVDFPLDKPDTAVSAQYNNRIWKLMEEGYLQAAYRLACFAEAKCGIEAIRPNSALLRAILIGAPLRTAAGELSRAL